MKKIAIAVGVLVVLVGVGVAVLLGNLNGIIKQGIETVGPEVLKAPVSLDSASVSVFSGSGQLKGLTIGNPKGYDSAYAFRLGKIKVDIDPESVTTDKIHVKEILIDAPDIMFDGGFSKNNLTQLQENAQAFANSLGAGKTGGDTSGAGKKIQIDRLLIQNGTVNVSMGILKGKPLTVSMPPIELRDIGKKKDASVSDVLKQVLASINKSVLPAVQGGVGDMLKNVGDMGKGIQEGATKQLDSVMGVFGK